MQRTQFQKPRSELLTSLSATQCTARSLRIGIIAEHNGRQIYRSQFLPGIFPKSLSSLRRWLPALGHQPRNGALRDVDSQLPQFTVNRRGIPQGMGLRHFAYQCPDLGTHLGPGTPVRRHKCVPRKLTPAPQRKWKYRTSVRWIHSATGVESLLWNSTTLWEDCALSCLTSPTPSQCPHRRAGGGSDYSRNGFAP